MEKPTNLSPQVIISLFQGELLWKKISVPHGVILRKALLNAGFSPYLGSKKVFNCRGMGICGTCKVLVKQNGQWWEKRSCQIQCFHPLEIQLK
jgi:hypothetical protein